MLTSRKRILILGISVALLIACAIVLLTMEMPSRKFTGPPESIRLGATPTELSALIWVAESRGYFTQNGLDVTIQVYESALPAIEDLLAGKQEIVTASDFTVADYSFDRHNLRILAVIDTCDVNKVVARGDRGIKNVSDLRGKRIGVVRGSASEFFLGRLLMFNNVPPQEVQIVDMSPSQQTEAIKKGELDAVIIWEPFAQNIMNLLGPSAVSLPAQSGQNSHWLLVTTDETISKRSFVIQRFLSAMLMATAFVDSNKSEAKDVVAKRLSLSPGVLESLWEQSRFDVTLSRSLTLTLEDQAKWLMGTRKMNRSKIPNFLNVVYLHGLKSLKPESVSIIHWEGSNDH